jgi:hypothetical protein
MTTKLEENVQLLIVNIDFLFLLMFFFLCKERQKIGLINVVNFLSYTVNKSNNKTQLASIFSLFSSIQSLSSSSFVLFLFLVVACSSTDEINRLTIDRLIAVYLSACCCISITL